MNKLFISISVFIIFLTGFTSHSLANTEKPEVYYFYTPHCEECSYLKESVFPKTIKNFGDRIIWKEINIDEHPENLAFALDMVFHDRKLGTLTPSIVIGTDVLMGARNIESHLTETIVKSLSASSSKDKSKADTTGTHPSFVLETVTPTIILLSGLVDGVNPCAFAAIAFLISILYVYTYQKKEIIIICLSYCIAVFITYLFIGLGFLNIIYSLKHFYKFAKVFRILVSGSCFLFAGLSIYDAVVYKKTLQGKQLILVLPDYIKKKISLLVGSSLRGKTKKGTLYLTAVTFILGVVVSCLEMVCTGQVYLPTIVYILKTSGPSPKALSYLILYNIFFVAPLLAVFFLCFIGVSSQSFNSFLKKNIAWLKLALALGFIGLGLGILFF